MKIPSFAVHAAVGAALVVLSGCPASQDSSPVTAPEVTVAIPVQKDVRDWAEYTGTTKSVQTLEVRARVEGELMSVREYARRLSEKLASQTTPVEFTTLGYYQVHQDNPPAADVLEKAKTAIRQSGFRQPLVVDTNNGIICGYTRYCAALQLRKELESRLEERKKLGLDQVPVYVGRDLTADQIRDYRSADIANKDLEDWYYKILTTWNFDLDDFKEGAMVARGSLLFVIEPEPFEAALAESRARREQARAQVNLRQADYARTLSLFQKKTVTQQDMDTATAERDAALAELSQQEANVRQAEIKLGYTKATAPFEGRVGLRIVDFGNLVGAGEATLLTTIEQIQPIYAYFDVDESIVAEVQRWRSESAGGNAQGEMKRDNREIEIFLGLADEKGFPHQGTLDYLDNAVDPQTGTALIRGVFANEKRLLYPGFFARLRIPGEPLEGAVLVDPAAIGTDLEGKYVWVVGEGDIAEKRHVERGPLVDGMQVIREGLSAEERYIVKGMQRARPGMPVKPVDPEAVAKPAPDKGGTAKTPPAKPAG